jgi:hypothetical protein
MDPGCVDETAEVTAVTARRIMPGLRAAVLRFAAFFPALAGLRAGARLREVFLLDLLDLLVLADLLVDLVAVLRPFLAGFFADFLLAFLAIEFLLDLSIVQANVSSTATIPHRTFARDSLSRFARAAKSKAAIKRIFPFLIAADAVRVRDRVGNSRTDLQSLSASGALQNDARSRGW